MHRNIQMFKLSISICLLFFIISSVQPQVVRRDCNESCGSMRIEYPFGIQDGCYLNESEGGFRVSCTTDSNNAPLLLWQPAEVPIESISLVDAELRALIPYATTCYQQNGSIIRAPFRGISMDTHEAFPFSNTRNRFTVVGCDTFARFENGERRTGCMSICPTNESMIVDGDGTGFCQTVIPPASYRLNITMGSYDNHTNVWNFNPCSSAFIAADDYYNFTHDDLRNRNVRGRTSVPIVIDWSIGNQRCEQAQLNLTSYQCGMNSICSNFTNGPGYNCNCSPGYQGNPYLPNGCQDVNECLGSIHNCADNSTCINTIGSYNCTCNEGFHDEGGQEGTGCRINSRDNNNLLSIFISVGVGAALLVVIIGSTIVYWIWRKRKYIKLKEKFFEKNGGFLLKQIVEQKEISSNMMKIFTAEELESATNNYDISLIAGKGGYGTVYKGTLPDGSLVAIKKSNQTDVSIDEDQVRQFISEIVILCQVNNRNIVHLRGCCFETPTPILVYEFVANGTLSEHLHKGRSSSMGILSMETRLKIASQTARVLSYLHSEAVIPIIHRDIKSTNILLDEDFNAKVSDFGASRLVASDEMQVCTLVQGTLGYLDPEYMQTGELTDKSDVYSFGVMLVELITGQKAVSFDKPETERNLAKYFLSALKENRLVQVLDRWVVQEGSFVLLEKVADIAKQCLSLFGEERPSMKQVAMELEAIIDFGSEKYSSPWVGPKIHSDKENINLLEDEVEGYSGRNITTSYDTVRNHVLITLPSGGR